MGVKSLQSYEASQIAREIADKAFEHLLEPHNVALNKLGMKAYKMLIDRLNIDASALIASWYAEASHTVQIKVQNTHGQELFATYMEEGAELANVSGYRIHLQIIDNALFDEVGEAIQQATPVREKCSALKEKLREQMTGKSAAHIKKAWPEAASFVDAQFGTSTSTGTPLTKPLEELLTRFLPALPAPTEV